MWISCIKQDWLSPVYSGRLEYICRNSFYPPRCIDAPFGVRIPFRSAGRVQRWIQIPVRKSRVQSCLPVTAKRNHSREKQINSGVVHMIGIVCFVNNNNNNEKLTWYTCSAAQRPTSSPGPSALQELAVSQTVTPNRDHLPTSPYCTTHSWL